MIKHFKKNKLRNTILSFLIPAIYRAVLEAIAKKTPIGYDTVAFYVESIMYPEFSLKGLKYFPLYNYILLLIKTVVKDAFLAIKIGAVLTSGLLGYSIYRWLKAIGFERKTLTYTLIVFFFLPNLRVTWDLHRNTFGIALALLAMSYLREGNKKLSYILAFISGFSHPFAALSLIAMNINSILLKKNNSSLIVVSLSGLGMLITQVPSLFSYMYEQITFTPHSNLLERILTTYVYEGWLFLPMFPFMKFFINNLKKVTRNFGSESLCWIICFLAVPPIFYFSNRFIIMLGIPVATLVIGDVAIKNSRKREVALITIIAISVVAYTPIKMINSSIPSKYTSEVLQLFDYCQEILDDNSIMVVHRALMGFALKTGINKSKIVVVEPYDNFKEKISSIENFTKIYTVWWLKGKTWKEEQIVNYLFPFMDVSERHELPEGYTVLKEGRGFAVYLYERKS